MLTQGHPRIQKEGDSAANPIPVYLDNEPPDAMDDPTAYDFTENLVNTSTYAWYAATALLSF